MICCDRTRACGCGGYCPYCGRYLGYIWPHTLPWRPWGYPPPYYPPFCDASSAIREGRAAVGMRG